jgi:GAF domain-containing protein
MNLIEIDRLVREVGLGLGADRCWLYARDPQRRAGIALVRWLRAPGVPDVPAELHRWTPEAADLATIDPLFARALAGHPVDVIDDAETGPCNAELERALGHRAFIHLNLHADGVLWGTLQPGMTATARRWTDAERDRLLAMRPRLTRLVAGSPTGSHWRPCTFNHPRA